MKITQKRVRNSTFIQKKGKQTVIWNQQTSRNPQIFKSYQKFDNYLKPSERQILMLKILKLFEKKITVQRQNSVRQNLTLIKEQNDLMQKILNRNINKQRQPGTVNNQKSQRQLVSSEAALAELDISNYNLKQELQKEYLDLSFKIKRTQKNLEKVTYKQQVTPNVKYLNNLQQRLEARKRSLMITQNKIRNWEKYKENQSTKCDQQKQQIISEYMQQLPCKYDKQKIKQNLLQLFSKIQQKNQKI